MAIHGGIEGAVGLVLAHEGVVGQKSGAVAIVEESAVPIYHDVVWFACAEDISASAGQA